MCKRCTLQMIIANMNKWIFHHHKFSYPGVLTCMHMMTCALLGRCVLQWTGRPPKVLASQTLSAVRRLSIVFVVSVASGNAALKYIHVSFAQSIGATGPLWTVLLSVFILRRSYPVFPPQL